MKLNLELSPVLFTVEVFLKDSILETEDTYGIFFDIDNNKPLQLIKRRYNGDDKLDKVEKIGEDNYILLTNVVKFTPQRDVVRRGGDYCDYTEMLNEEDSISYSTFSNSYEKIWKDIKDVFESFLKKPGYYSTKSEEFVFIINCEDDYDPAYSYMGLMDMNKVVNEMYRESIEKKYEKSLKKQYKYENDIFTKMMNE